MIFIKKNIFLKKIFQIISILLIFGQITTYAVEENIIIKCTWKKDYDLYKCEIKNICSLQEYWKNEKKVIKLDKFYKKEIPLEKIKVLYKENQNKIYKCSILNSQEIVFTQVQKILTETDKTWDVMSIVIKKIEDKKIKIQQLKKQSKCIDIKENWQKEAIKKIILDQSSLELCNYRYYLKYLNNTYYSDLKNIVDPSKKVDSAKNIEKKQKWIKNKIEDEINHSLKVFPIAYESYTQYEGFLKIHIMFELLEEDFIVFRNRLYETLHSINQLVYKIINAQSK